jgi:hypothetical protein
MCTLQGVTSAQVEAIPIWGLPKSASVKPTARSMARLGARVTPSTTGPECLRDCSSLMGKIVLVYIRCIERAIQPRNRRWRDNTD